MVDIKHRPLRAFKQNTFSRPPRFLQQAPHHIHERQHVRRNIKQLLLDAVARDLRLTKAAPQRVMMGKQTINLVIKMLRISEIGQSDGARPILSS